MAKTKRMSAKQKIHAFLSKETGKNTLSVEQARTRFKIQNVAARIYDLRKEGVHINTVTKILRNGTRSKIYALAQ